MAPENEAERPYPGPNHPPARRALPAWLRYPPLILLAALGLLLAPLVLSGGGPLPAGARADRIVVHKSLKRLDLMQGGTVLKSYRVALGREPGRKTRQGDNRTPEGKYENCRRTGASRFYQAIAVTYPNPEERRRGFTGGHIEIHGLERLPWGLEHILGPWLILFGHTEGCVMVTNPHMDEILRSVSLPVTVEIRP